MREIGTVVLPLVCLRGGLSRPAWILARNHGLGEGGGALSFGPRVRGEDLDPMDIGAGLVQAPLV